MASLKKNKDLVYEGVWGGGGGGGGRRGRRDIRNEEERQGSSSPTLPQPLPLGSPGPFITNDFTKYATL